MTSFEDVSRGVEGTPASSSGSTRPLLGGYTLERELGRGGMGAVYLARSPQGLPVALKVLLGHSLHDVGALVRFAREGQVGAFRHPHLVSVLGSGRDQGHPFLVLEYVHGASLADRLRRGPLAPDEAARVGLAVAKGLAHLHAHGIVHRDLKPENVLIGDDGSVKVTDFGIAAVQAQTRERLTQTGELLGTPAYMAPEQADDVHSVAACTDVYSWGATLYHALVGEPPFTGPSALAVLTRVVSEPAPPLPKTAPRRLAALIERCLAKDPDERPSSAEALVEALESTEGGGAALGSWRRWGGGAVVCGVVVAALWGGGASEDEFAEATAPPSAGGAQEAKTGAVDVAAVQSLLLERRATEAQALLAKGEADPETTALLRAWGLAVSGRAEAAEAALPHQPGMATPPLFALARAAAYEASGNLTEALRVLQRPLVDSPALTQRLQEVRGRLVAEHPDVPSEVQLRVLFADADASSDPAALLEQGLALYSQEGRIAARLGDALRASGDGLAVRARALASYEQALRCKAPLDGLAFRARAAELAFELERFEVVVELLEGWWRVLSPPQRRWFAVALAEQQRYAEAAPKLERLLRAQPDDGRVAFQLGRSYEALGELDAALEQYVFAADRSAQPDVAPRLALLQLRLRLDALDDAKQDVTWLLAQFPDDAQVQAASGHYYMALRQPARALEHFERAGELLGAGRSGQSLLEGTVRALEARGRLVEAGLIVEELRRRFPDSPYAAPLNERRR